MSINGRINLDAVFHDTDGTASISVVSMHEAEEFSSGVVAVMTLTASGVLQSLPVTPTTYRNAAGNLVPLDGISHVLLRSNSGTVVYADQVNSVVVPSGQTVLLATVVEQDPSLISIYADGGTASYTIVLIGL